MFRRKIKQIRLHEQEQLRSGDRADPIAPDHDEQPHRPSSPVYGRSGPERLPATIQIQWDRPGEGLHDRLGSEGRSEGLAE